MLWPLRDETQIFGNLMAADAGCLEARADEESEQSRLRTLPLAVVSRHSQELPTVLDDAALSVSDRSAHLNALKMNCYALIRLVESFETMSSQTSLMDLDLGKVIGVPGSLNMGPGEIRGSMGKKRIQQFWESCLSFFRIYEEVLKNITAYPALTRTSFIFYNL